MKIFLAALFLLPLGAFAQIPKPAATPIPDLVTLSGKTYKQARVFRAEPDGLNYMFRGGMVKIPFTDLPEAVRKQYGYDPKAANAFAVADEQQQARAYEAAQGQLARVAQQKQADYEAAAQHATSDSLHTRNDAPLPDEPKVAIDPNWQGGLKTLAKLSVDQVATSPFTLK